MTLEKTNVVIFSGANAPKEYEELAYRVGTMLASHGFTAVTGGGPGMMRAVNRGAFEAKGKSWGICIKKREEEMIADYFTEYEMHNTFDRRNDRLISLGASFVVLPGGLGTVTEALQITQRKKFREMPKEMPLLFVGTYYEKMTQVFSDMKTAGFVSEELSDLYQYVRDEKHMIDVLTNYQKDLKKNGT